MIIADTSIWVDYFNGIERSETDTLDSALDDGAVAIGDIIFLEILQGFRNDKDYKMAKTKLSPLDQFEMFGHAMVSKCADNYRFLRKKGITIRKTTDIIIATFCIDNRVPLLYSDRDFIAFTKHLGLKSALQET